MNLLARTAPASMRLRSNRSSRAPSWMFLAIADAWALSIPALALPGRVAVPFIAIAALTAAAQGCYRHRFTGQLGAILARLLASVGVAASVVASIVAVWAPAIVRVAALVFVAMVVARVIAGATVRSLATRTAGAPTLIVGAGAVGARIARDLRERREYGLQPVGILDDVDHDDDHLELPLLGGTDELQQVVERFDVEHVIVAFGKAPEERVVEVIRACEDIDAEVWVVPRMFELGVSTSATDMIYGTPVNRLNRHALRSGQWRLKRVMDVTVAGAVLAVIAPLAAALAFAVKLSSPGPVFFRQERVGQRGRSFDMLKFRTLRVAPVIASVDGVDPGAIQAAREADVSRRVTAVGAFLRKTSLDELPQLLNIIRGDMSLVGPRPEEVGFAATFSEAVRGYEARHRVPVGLTGLAQVNGLRGDTSIEDRAAFDNRYIENWSLWGDLVILFRTVLAVVNPPRCVHIDAPGHPIPAGPVEASVVPLTPVSRTERSRRSSERVTG